MATFPPQPAGNSPALARSLTAVSACSSFFLGLTLVVAVISTGSATLTLLDRSYASDSSRIAAVFVLAVALAAFCLSHQLIRLAKTTVQPATAKRTLLTKSAALGAVGGGAMSLLAAVAVVRQPVPWLTIVAVVALTTSASALILRRAASNVQRSAKAASTDRGAAAKVRDAGLALVGLVLLAGGLVWHDHIPGGQFGVGLAVSLGALSIAYSVARTSKTPTRHLAHFLGARTASEDQREATGAAPSASRRGIWGVIFMGLACFAGGAAGARLVAVSFQGVAFISEAMAHFVVGGSVLAMLFFGASALIVDSLETRVRHQIVAPAPRASVDLPRTRRVLARQVAIGSVTACLLCAAIGAGLLGIVLSDLYVRPLEAWLLNAVWVLSIVGAGMLMVFVASVIFSPVIRATHGDVSP